MGDSIITAMWQAASNSKLTSSHNNDNNNIKYYFTSADHRFSLYMPSAGLIGLCRRDLLSALVSAGCAHLAIKILDYLDSPSLLAASLVCRDWQQFLLDWFYATPKFRERVRRSIFGSASHAGQQLKLGRTLSRLRSPGCAHSKLTFSLAMARAAVVDVAVDDDLNLYALAILAGRPHVMSCSLFTQVSMGFICLHFTLWILHELLEDLFSKSRLAKRNQIP